MAVNLALAASGFEVPFSRAQSAVDVLRAMRWQFPIGVHVYFNTVRAVPSVFAHGYVFVAMHATVTWGPNSLNMSKLLASLSITPIVVPRITPL